jgi:hypothetical protein
MKTFSAFWTGPLDAAIREAAAAPYTMSLVGEDAEAVGQHGGADLFALTHSLRLPARAAQTSWTAATPIFPVITIPTTAWPGMFANTRPYSAALAVVADQLNFST